MEGACRPDQVRRLFQDLLGRPPYENERASSIGRELSEVVSELLGNEESWSNWFEEQLYYFLLVDNFRPTTEKIESIPRELTARTIGVREVLQRFCLSSSFDRRNPGPDTFVSVVMEQLLGITVQKTPRELEMGKRLYDGTRGTFLGQQGNAQADVVSIAISDPRAITHFLTREYSRVLRHEVPPSDLSRWAAVLEKDDRELGAILAEWLLSPAYERRMQVRCTPPNRIFVRSLFVDVLGRLPSSEETQRLRGALDGLAQAGPLRALVARVVLDSKEARIPAREAIDDPRKWIAGLFERLLGRLPTTDEQSTFLSAFEDPACKPSTVLYAILSHPEYQTW